MGDMGTRELQHTLTTERVFQRLLADGAFAADERPVSAGPGTINVHQARHWPTRPGIKRGSRRGGKRVWVRLPGRPRMRRVRIGRSSDVRRSTRP